MGDEIDNFDQLDAMNETPAKSSKLPWLLLLGVLGGAGAGGFWGYRQLTAAAKDASAKVDEAQKRADAAEASQAELNQRLERIESEKADLIALKNDLYKEVQAKEDEVARLKGTYEKLEEKMKAEIKKGDIHVSQIGGKLRVDLVDKVLFDSGESKVSKRGEEVLARVGAILSGIDDKQIQVSGHTDDSPISDKLLVLYPTNWELSVTRATNVVRFLQEKAGVKSKYLVASGYSQYHPVATNANHSGRARNRRIEILLTPLIESKPVALATKAEPKEKGGKGKKGRRK